MKTKAIAHFLLTRDLATSPYNEALISAMLDVGASRVDIFSPDGLADVSYYGKRVTAKTISYGWKAIPSVIADSRWQKYCMFSGTSETPLGLVGILSTLWRRPSVALADEIRTANYRGSDAESWKKLCRYTIRNADIAIVNDPARIELLVNYAGGPIKDRIIVLPAAYRTAVISTLPRIKRQTLGIPKDAFVIAFSGGFSKNSGADWFLQALDAKKDVWGLLNPLQINDIHIQLLEMSRFRSRLTLRTERLSWFQAWSLAAVADLGVAIYRGSKDQAQAMGTSSNRLCQFIAMGVPVIASQQKSFEFLQDYGCGILANNSTSFISALEEAIERISDMKHATIKCNNEYIQSSEAYQLLCSRLNDLCSFKT